VSVKADQPQFAGRGAKLYLDQVIAKKEILKA
jgi:hypothetical protein